MAKGKKEKSKALVVKDPLAGKLPEDSDALRKRTLDLRCRINTDFVYLAGAIQKIYHQGYWQGWGFSSFKEYVETELSIGYRQSMHYIGIMDSIDRYGIPLQRAIDLGWTRMREIVPHITDGNVQDLLTRAEGMSASQIQQEFLVTPPTTTRHTINVVASASEASAIFDAIDEAKRRLETESTSSALEYICQEWMMGNEGDASQLDIDSVVDFVHRNYGVTLVKKDEEEQPDLNKMMGEE